jgi:hypothetical protein
MSNNLSPTAPGFPNATYESAAQGFLRGVGRIGVTAKIFLVRRKDDDHEKP